MTALASTCWRRGVIDLRRQLWAWQPFAYVVLALGCAALLPQDCKVSPGVVIFAAALAGGCCQGLGFGRLLRLAGLTVRRYSPALLTICAVLALGKIMGASGMIRVQADALIAFTGRGYCAVASVVGALGGFVTGSGTSSNVLFGALQASVASSEAERYLFAAANLMGAGIGATILQIGYSFLIGAMCSVVLLGTRNIWICVMLHAIYDFCGTLMPTLGAGTWWDTPTVVFTAVLAVATAVYLVWQFFRLDLDEVGKIFKA
jgi:hypothetical protein